MPIEWWYFSGHLQDDRGEEYSFHFVTFQRITANGLAPQVLHASFSDHTKGLYNVAEKLALAPTPTSPGSFSFQAQGWRMAGDGLDYVLAFDIRDYFLLLR
ncbi:MAG TPA: lipocalin-like domain-containing protein, partial [Dehalococcoidia bacterium]|nr:lipocalin-like domain-containing protein [Dehalococcoidia bacterium]